MSYGLGVDLGTLAEQGPGRLTGAGRANGAAGVVDAVPAMLFVLLGTHGRR